MPSNYSNPPDITVDFRSAFPRIRDQGQRPLCFFFAASDTNSFTNGLTEPLSIEYLAYHSYEDAGEKNFDAGLRPQQVLKVLESKGQPPESKLPYDPTLSKPQEPTGSYPELYCSRGTQSPSIFDDIIESLNKGEPLILVLNIPGTFFRPTSSNIIDDDGTVRACHAVICLGYGTYSDGEKVLLIRNSWGSMWGDNGHAWLTKSLIESKLISTIFLEK